MKIAVLKVKTVGKQNLCAISAVKCTIVQLIILQGSGLVHKSSISWLDFVQKWQFIASVVFMEEKLKLNIDFHPLVYSIILFKKEWK